MPKYQGTFPLQQQIPVVESLKSSRLTSRQARKQYLNRQKGKKLSWEEERQINKQRELEDIKERAVLKAKEVKEARAAKSKRARELKKIEAHKKEMERVKNGQPVKAKWDVDEAVRQQQSITQYYQKTNQDQEVYLDDCHEVNRSAVPPSSGDLPTIAELVAESRRL